MHKRLWSIYKGFDYILSILEWISLKRGIKSLTVIENVLNLNYCLVLLSAYVNNLKILFIPSFNLTLTTQTVLFVKLILVSLLVVLQIIDVNIVNSNTL